MSYRLPNSRKSNFATELPCPRGDTTRHENRIYKATVPGPSERAGQPVGLAYFAIASAETIHTQEMRVAPRRITLKRRVSNAALIELSKLLRGDLHAHIEAHW